MVLRIFLFHGCLSSQSGVMGLVPKIAAKKVLGDNSNERFRLMTGLYRVGSNAKTCWVLFEIGRTSLSLENMIAIVGWGAPGCACTCDAFGNQPSTCTTPTFCQLPTVSCPIRNSLTRKKNPSQLCSLAALGFHNAIEHKLSYKLITSSKCLASERNKFTNWRKV